MRPVSVATKRRLRSFFFLLTRSSLNNEIAFSNCFFDLAIASAKRSVSFIFDLFFSAI